MSLKMEKRTSRSEIIYLTSQVTECRPRKTRLHLARDLLKEPSQAIAILPFGASIYDAEGQKQIPIADARQERVQSLLIERAAGRKLTPKGEWLIVILT